MISLSTFHVRFLKSSRNQTFKIRSKSRVKQNVCIFLNFNSHFTINSHEILEVQLFFFFPFSFKSAISSSSSSHYSSSI